MDKLIDTIDYELYDCFGIDHMDKKEMEDIFSKVINETVPRDNVAWNYMNNLKNGILHQYYNDSDMTVYPRRYMSDVLRSYIDFNDRYYDLFCEEVARAHNSKSNCKIDKLSYGVMEEFKAGLKPMVDKLGHPYSNEEKFVLTVLSDYLKGTVRIAKNANFIKNLYDVDEPALIKEINDCLDIIDKVCKYEDELEKSIYDNGYGFVVLMELQGDKTCAAVKTYDRFKAICSPQYKLNNIPFDLDDNDELVIDNDIKEFLGVIEDIERAAVQEQENEAER